jgi:hypothetical protein
VNLYLVTVCRILLAPVRAKYVTVLIHAKTPQVAGRILKRQYPQWERVEWHCVGRHAEAFILDDWEHTGEPDRSGWADDCLAYNDSAPSKERA